MRLIQTIATFLVALLVIGFAVGMMAGNALRMPDADPARWMVWLGIVIGAGVIAWLRWTMLGRSAAPTAERKSAAPPTPPMKAEEIEASVADRLGRISQRGRDAPAVAAPIPEIVMPPVLDEPPQPDVVPEPEAFPSPPPFPEEPDAPPPVEEPSDPFPEEEPVPFAPQPVEEPFPEEEPVPFAPPPMEEPPLPEPSPDDLPPLDLMEPEDEPADLMPPPEDLPPADLPPPPAMPMGGPMLATKRSKANTGGLSPIGAGDPDEEEEEPEEEEEFEEAEDAEEAEEAAEPEAAGEFEQAAAPMPAEPAAAEPAPLAEGGRTAILLRQHFPPPHDGGLSFFGGAPIASPAFAWPRVEGGAPFSFLMQVDCAALPAHARMGMPDRGILYVFMDLTWAQNAWRVIHEAAPSGELMEIAPPDDLPPVFGDQARSAWKWPRSAEEAPRLLPKWPFNPLAISLPPETWGDLGAPNEDEDDADPRLLWPHGNAISEILAAAQGEVIGPDWFTIKDFAAADGGLIRPFANYPHDARAIQIMAGMLLERLEGYTRGQIRVPDHDSVAPEDREALLDKIAAEAREWYADAALEPPFIEVPQEFADQFWQWLSTFPWFARFVIQDALTLSIEESLTASAEAAARIPPEVARRIRHRHALAVHTDTGIHANNPDRMLAPPIDVQGNQYERAQSHILLLEISSNEGLGHHFGEGVYQFWITPEDLQAGRFDKVELTADAY